MGREFPDIKEKNSVMEIKDINIYLKKREEYLLKDFSLKIIPGSVTTIRGASGTGKSILLKLLSNYPLKDNIQFSGEISSNNRKVYRVTQEPYFQLFHRTVNEEFAFTDKSKIRHYLTFFGISDYENRKILTLSSGEKKLITVIKGFLSSANIILMDEPFSYLDERNSLKLKELIEKEANSGRSFLITDHTGYSVSGEQFQWHKQYINKTKEFIPDNISNFFIVNENHSSVTIEDLQIDLNNKVLWEEFNFSVPQGNIVGVIGNNGSGKTTLLKYIAGWIKGKSGKIIVSNKQWGKIRDRRNKLAFVSTQPETQLYKKNVKDELQSHKIDLLSLEKWNLEKTIDLPIQYLSFGEKIRLNALIAEDNAAEVILLDDIYPALDKNSRIMLNKHINNWIKEGKTIFFTNTEPINCFYNINKGNYNG